MGLSRSVMGLLYLYLYNKYQGLERVRPYTDYMFSWLDFRRNAVFVLNFMTIVTEIMRCCGKSVALFSEECRLES
jgi:hypothetical protein